jgi:predicted dehydrogenase
MGFIGLGGQGFGYNMRTFLHQKDAVVTATCDVKKSQSERAKQAADKQYKNKDCRCFTDFRKLLELKDIDAICISTPDHWHAPLSMMALETGKHVMCEKPTLTIVEGQKLIKEVEKRKAVFQWGIEDRSVLKYHMMAEWVLNGAIGKLKLIDVTLPNGRLFRKEEPMDPPADLDWNLWLGPAPFHKYTRTRTHANHWREIFDYSGGQITDWGSHLVDTAQIAAGVDKTGPIEVEGQGEIPKDAQTNVPIKYKVTLKYANGATIVYRNGGTGIKFEGEGGWIKCDRWRGRITASSDDILRTKYEKGKSKHWPIPPGEHRDFLNCIKSKKKCAYHAEAGHKLFVPLHLGHIAIRLGRKLKWDPEKEVVDDKEAAKMMDRPARDWQKA